MIDAALSIFAQATPPAPSSGDISTAMTWVGGLIAVVVIANQVMAAMINARKLRGADPETDERLDGRYASKTAVEEVSRELATLRADVRNVTTTVANELREIHRALGRIEGQLGTSER